MKRTADKSVNQICYFYKTKPRSSCWLWSCDDSRLLVRIFLSLISKMNTLQLYNMASKCFMLNVYYCNKLNCPQRKLSMSD